MNEYTKAEKLAAKTHEMYEATLTDDHLALFLRAHLHLESAITERLDQQMRAGVFDWESESSPEFMTRAKMAFGLNILDQHGYNFAKKAARIRNEFAHRLDRKLDEADFTALHNQVNEECKEFIRLNDQVVGSEWRKKPEWLRLLLAMMWYQTVLAGFGQDAINQFLEALRKGEIEPAD